MTAPAPPPAPDGAQPPADGPRSRARALLAARASYALRGTWRVGAPVAQVAEVLVDLERYPEWWPQVRAVGWLGPDDGLVLCRSALPYTLALRLRARRREPPALEVALEGDLTGTVRWHLTEEPGGGTRVDVEQDVVAGGGLALLSAVARPLLRWNHDRMMADGMRGLRARLGGRPAR